MKDYRLGLYEKSMPNSLSWKKKLEATKEAGFDFLEMSIDETDEKIARLQWTKEQVWNLLGLCKETEIGIESICLSGHRKYPLGSSSKDLEEKGMEMMMQAIDLAAMLNIRIIQVAGYDVYYSEGSTPATKERFFRNLKKSVSYAGSKGVILAMETMENDFMNTIEKAMYYVEEIHSPYLGVYPDIGNITNATTHVCRDIRNGKGHIFAAHLKETVPGKFREIPYGTGNVDFPSAIKVLKEQGVNKFLAEFWYVDNEDWFEVLKYNYNFLERQIQLADSL